MQRKRSRLDDLAPNLARIGGYEVAPEKLQDWIRDASVTNTTFSTEKGRRVADYNIARVSAKDVKSTDICLAAVEDPDEGELMDMDFLASSNVMFYEFVGLPGVTA